jgi:hypothetical protein
VSEGNQIAELKIVFSWRATPTPRRSASTSRPGKGPAVRRSGGEDMVALSKAVVSEIFAAGVG